MDNDDYDKVLIYRYREFKMQNPSAYALEEYVLDNFTHSSVQSTQINLDSNLNKTSLVAKNLPEYLQAQILIECQGKYCFHNLNFMYYIAACGIQSLLESTAVENLRQQNNYSQGWTLTHALQIWLDRYKIEFPNEVWMFFEKETQFMANKDLESIQTYAQTTKNLMTLFKTENFCLPFSWRTLSFKEITSHIKMCEKNLILIQEIIRLSKLNKS